MASGGNPIPAEGTAYRRLASYRNYVDRMETAWPGFLERRRQRLVQGVFGDPAEKVAENTVEDLCTTVLDWPAADIGVQADRPEVVLSALGIERLVLEVKRPGGLIWHPGAVQAALAQARRYAAAQKIKTVAVSDGSMLYAADVTAGGLRDRALVALDADTPPEALWWVSAHGISLPPEAGIGDLAWPTAREISRVTASADDGLRDAR